MPVVTQIPSTLIRHVVAYAAAGGLLGVVDAGASSAAWATLLVGTFLGAAQRLAAGPRVGPAWIATSGLAWTGGVLVQNVLARSPVGTDLSLLELPVQLGSWVVPMVCTIAAQAVLIGRARAAAAWTLAMVLGSVALQATVAGTCALLCQPIASTAGPSMLPIVLTAAGFISLGAVAGLVWTRVVAFDGGSWS